VLEAEEHAQARGATVLGRLSGYGHTTDFFHLTQPQPAGDALVEVMRGALREAGVTPWQIGYINAHGTATPINDSAETAAYLALFDGDLTSTQISSTKAAIGHTLGAAGSIEALFALEALRSGRLPPQLNVQKPIPEIASALVKPGATDADLRHVMSVNLGFGGSNAALVFSK
jgi:3-oxoacyl-[acyl-carrier-protein] synthase II